MDFFDDVPAMFRRLTSLAHSYLGLRRKHQPVILKAHSLDGLPPSLGHCRRFRLFPIQDRGYSLRH